MSQFEFNQDAHIIISKRQNMAAFPPLNLQ